MSDKQIIILPDYKNCDEFIRIFSKMMTWFNWVGIRWHQNIKNFLWSTSLIIMYYIFGLWSISKIFKDRSTVNIDLRFSGFLVFSTIGSTLIGFRRMKKFWILISAQWTTTDQLTNEKDPNLKKNMSLLTILFITLATGEILIGTLTAVEKSTSYSDIFKTYVINLTMYGIITKENYTLAFGCLSIYIKVALLLTWSFRDLIITYFGYGLTSKQKRLNKYIKKLCDRSITNTISKPSRHEWRQAREACVRHRALVRTVDNAIGPLIILFCIANLFFIIRQIYSWMGKINPSVELSQVITRTYVLFYLCIRTYLVLHIVASLHSESRKVVDYFKEIDHNSYNAEIRRLEFQLRKDNVALSGMGFFTLDRSCILRVVSVIITYVLIILQYDSRINKH